MSDNAQNVTSYADKIGLEPVSLSVARGVAQLCWYDRHVPMFISESGIGKTALMKSLGRAHDMDVIIYSLAHCEPSDITGPMWPTKDGTAFTNLRDERVPIEGEDDRALAFCDEPNRADMTTLNAVFPLWTERRLGSHKIGENVVVAAAMNPPEGDYAVTSQFSTDPAMRRRTCQIYVIFNLNEWARHAKNPGQAAEIDHFPRLDNKERFANRDPYRPMHHAVIEFVEAHADLALDVKSRQAGKVYANPASWEQVSDTFHTIEELELDTDSAYVERVVKTKIAGHIGAALSNDVWAYYRKHADVIDPREVLLEYKTGAPIHEKIHRMIQRGHVGQLASLTNVMASVWVSTPDMDDKVVAKCLGLFLSEVPMQVASQVIEHLTAHDAESSAGGASVTSERLAKLSLYLSSDDNFKKYRRHRNETVTENAAAAKAAQSDAS